jgi:PST family polysaccharide transporter
LNKEIDVFKSISRSAFDFKIIKFVLFSYGIGFIRFRTYVFLAIRNNIIQTLDYSQAGYWETMMRISTYCFCKYCFDCLFLPKLAVAKNNQETKTFFGVYKGILPVFILGDYRLFYSFFYR